MKKLLTLATLATIALASCNNDNDNVPVPTGDDLIRFGAEALSVNTKAPFEGVISGSNTLTAHILGTANSGNYAAASIHQDAAGAKADGMVTFNDNGTTESSFDTGVKWPTGSSDKVYFRGYYPAESSVWNVGANSAEATIDGKTDLMNAPEINGSKSSVAVTPLKFKFSHLLTKLHVKVQGNAATADDWGNIVKIELSKAVNVVPSNLLTCTYAGEVISFSGTQTIPFYVATGTDAVSYTDDVYAAQDYVVPTASTLVAYSLVAPVTAVAGNGGANDEYTLKITTTKGAASSGRDVAINLKSTDGKDFVGSTAGKKFDITIQFLSEGQITATATVTDWVDGGSGTGQM
ncbi:fimbrillin family protein [Parabacteroides sp.]